MKTLLRIAAVVVVFGSWNIMAASAQSSAPAELDRYNVVWTTPSGDASGSMPIGNGEVGLNVWVEENGDLVFYVARTDAWSECCRLLKLGRIRVSLSPNPFAKGQPFRQELKLRDGQIIIHAGDAMLKVFVDADAPVVHVTGESATPHSVTAKFETWRTEKHVLKGEELESARTMSGAPASIEVWESADVVAESDPGAVVWYHRNESSVVPFTLNFQGLESVASAVKDPLLNRTFGGRMAAKGFVKECPNTLKSTAPMKQFSLAIAAHVAQTDSAADWQREAADILQKADDVATAAQRTATWWNDFWNRSWIFVSGDHDAEKGKAAEPAKWPADDAASVPSQVTQAYVLQRWMTACGGRGNYPIKFNGSIFNVEPGFTENQFDFSADWRKWGDCYWWQNTRLPYAPMTARGDFDQSRVLFRFYRDILPICKARAKVYFDADGAYFPETVNIFGTYANCDYNWNRTGHKPNEVLNKYLRWIWQDGPELLALMLDHFEYTDDQAFLNDELIPMAHEVLRYYDTRFPRDDQGTLMITPTQVLETYWEGVVNDTPNVAGLNDMLDRLLAIPADVVPAGEREYWQKMKAATPVVPLKTENGKTWITPAEKFVFDRTNCENPETYAIWPFRLYGVGRPNLEVGIETFHRRIAKMSTGWQYDGQDAALLGLTDEVKALLLGKVTNSNPNHRFPAMWGPNYDWLPDQCHGGNIMLTLQYMLLQPVGEKVYVMPAWPKDWDVEFKLYAPHRTTIECVYRGGKIEKLAVTPESRRADVQLPIWLNSSNERTP